MEMTSTAKTTAATTIAFIKEKPLLDTAIEVMNQFFKADPEGCTKLVDHRVKTTQAVCEHKTIQVSQVGDSPKVGVLGIINGILEAHCGERLAGIFDDNGKLSGFIRYPKELQNES